MQRHEDSMTTPLTSESQFIQAGSFAPAPDSAYLIPADDYDDLDEENIPGFSHPGFASTPTQASADKGKARAPDQLAEPSGSIPRTPLSGNIGTPTGSGSRATRRIQRTHQNLLSVLNAAHAIPYEQGEVLS